MKTAYVIVGAILVAVLAGAGGFYGGMTFARSQATNTVADFARQRAVQNGQTSASGQTNANDPCGFGGRATQFQNQGNAQGGTQNGAQANGQNAQGGSTGGGFRGPGGFAGLADLGNCVARGQIKSVTGNTVEISTAASVVTITVSDQTVISKTDRGTLADLKAGDRVTVFSKETGDKPAASAIQLQSAAPATQ